MTTIYCFLARSTSVLFHLPQDGNDQTVNYLSFNQRLNRGFRTVILALALLLSACSIKFVYNQLDWVIPWYMDDYVSFNPAQQLLLDQRLEYLLAWHRKDQLPEYTDFIEQLAADSQDGLDNVEIDVTYQQVQLFANQLIDVATPLLVELLSDINDQQSVQLFDNLKRENEEYRKKYIDLSEIKQRQRRANEVRKFIQRWTGLLDEQQIALIQQWSTTYQLMGKEFLQSRLLWQQQLKTILQQRQHNSSVQQGLTDLLQNHRFGHSATFEQKATANKQLLQQLLLSLVESLSQQQRSQMIKKMKSYAEDFRQLSSQ